MFRRTVEQQAFQPPQPPTYAVSSGLTWIPVQLSSRDRVHIAVYFVPAPSTRKETQPRYTLVFSHGNGEDLGTAAGFLEEMARLLEVNVVGYDYPGYGPLYDKDREALPPPTEHGAYKALTSVLAWLEDANGWNTPHSQIVLCGHSLGSGPTVHVAASLSPPPAGVILMSPLRSAMRVVGLGMWFFDSYVGDIFVNQDKIDRILCPVFIVHGRHDEVVPVSHGMDLARRLRIPVDPLYLNCGHNDIVSACADEFFGAVRQFIGRLSMGSQN